MFTRGLSRLETAVLTCIVTSLCFPWTHSSVCNLNGYYHPVEVVDFSHQSEHIHADRNQSQHDGSVNSQSDNNNRPGNNQTDKNQWEEDCYENQTRSDCNQTRRRSHSAFFDHVQQALQSLPRCRSVWIHANLSFNKLTYLPATLFNNSCSKEIITLDLSHNKLQTLDQSWLVQLRSLKALNVSHNHLHTLSHNGLDVLPLRSILNNLQCLDVSFNQVTRLENGLFDQFHSLRTLDVSHNHISGVQPRAFHAGMDSVILVNFSYNRLSAFEPWPYLFNEGVLADLSHNVISRFTNRMNLTLKREMMREIHLTYNNLTRLAPQDFSIYLNGSQLTPMILALHLKLILRHNPFVCDCHLHWIIDILKDSLLMENHEARSYLTCASPPVLRGRPLGYLYEHADLMVCDVPEGCPNGCRCLDTPHHRHLAITCNPQLHNYTQLPQKLPGHDLISLNLSGHALSELEVGHCDGVGRLEVLDVSDNRVKRMSTAFLEAAINLKVLNLRNNQLTSLPSNLQRLSVENLHLSGNPLVCSCDLVSFGNWLKAIAANATSSEKLRSTTPKSTFEDRDLSQANLESDDNLLEAAAAFLSNHDSDPNGSGSEPVSNVSKPVSDTLTLTCKLSDGRQIAVADTSQWGISCETPVTLYLLIGGGVVLLLLLAGMVICWRWRYNIRVFLNYFFLGIPCFNSKGEPDLLDHEAESRDETSTVYGLYVSVDEEDEKEVTWTKNWLLPLLENRGRNPIRVYFPSRQEPPGVCKADNRAEVISQSRKVMIVLSKGYASNTWCRFELDQACHHMQQHNHKNLVIVLRADAGDITDRETAREPQPPAACNFRCDPCSRVQTRNDDDNVDDDRQAIIRHGIVDNQIVINMDENAETIPHGNTGCNAACLERNKDEDKDRDDDEDDDDGPNKRTNGDCAPHKNTDCGGVVNGNQKVFRNGDALQKGTRNGDAIPNGDAVANGVTNGTVAIELTHINVTKKNIVAQADNRDDRPRAKPKEKGIPNEKQQREKELLEELSQYTEHGQIVQLEPLRSFLMEGHYLSASDCLFKYKLVLELSRKRKERHAHV